MVKQLTPYWLWLGFWCIARVTCEWFEEHHLTEYFYELTVTNNGPVVWGSNITFNAVLSHSLDLPYKWTWEDGIHPPVTIKAGGHCQLQTSYKEPGDYTMNVTVTYVFLPIASKPNNFKIDTTIPGKIELFVGNETTPLEKYRYLPTGSNVAIRTQLYDPSDFLANSNLLYWLYVDNVVVTSAGPNSTYNFTGAGDFRVVVFVNAYSLTGEVRWGSYYSSVKIREPIHHINITGNTLLQRGEMVKLVADCDGSSPWVYCWKPFDNDNTTEKQMSCSNVATTNKCNFQIQYYFPHTGNHKILVNITNDVKRFIQIVPINIFKVLPEPDLSIIVIPVVFGLLAITIILVGLLYYVQVRRRFTIEVADFDFTSSDSVIYQTFYEQLKDAIINTMPRSNNILERGWNFLDCRTDFDTLSTSTFSSDASDIKPSEGTVEVATALPLP